MRYSKNASIVVNARFLTQKITGTQRFAIEISKRLKKLLPSVKFVAPHNILHKDLAEELETNVIGNTTSHLWEQITLPRYLKAAGNPILINLVNTAPLFYKKQIVTIHDLAFLRNPKWFSKTFYLYYRFLIPKIVKNSQKILTVSYFSKNEIMELLHIPQTKIEVIYNAVDVKFHFNPNAKKKKYILTVSSIDPRKNLKNLILAYKKLSPKDYKLIIAGSKNKIFNNTDFREAINGVPGIEFTGHVNDKKLVKLYQEATLFVFPSLYEGFGLPPLEAMACGTPVIVSKTASLPEVCGDAAYYVDPHDPDNIAKGIKDVLYNKELQNQLIAKGFARVKMFEWKNSVEKLLKIINELPDT